MKYDYRNTLIAGLVFVCVLIDEHIMGEGYQLKFTIGKVLFLRGLTLDEKCTLF